MKTVLITTAHRGVFVGNIPDDQDLRVNQMPLLNAIMVIYWGTTKGLHQLCSTGPTSTSRLSAPADIAMLHDITAVFDLTPEAQRTFGFSDTPELAQ